MGQMHHLDRAVERHAGIERQHEPIGEEGRVERGKRFIRPLVLGERVLDKERPLGERRGSRSEIGTVRQRRKIGKLGREAAANEHDAI